METITNWLWIIVQFLLYSTAEDRISQSSNCKYLQYLDENKCVPCKNTYGIPKTGYEFTDNCGHYDFGGRHDRPMKQCDDGKYNDGTHELCQECTNCTSELLLKNCTKESNTLCCNPREEKAPDGTCRNKNSIDEINTTKVPLGTQSISEKDNKHGKDWITTVLVILAIVVIGTIFVTVLIILQKRKRTSLCEENNESYAGDSNNPAAYVHFKCENQICDLEMIPLQKVLDNIDMLEELIMVLDPDVKNRKNTRHIAARYGLQANWIIYAYSRMDHYSPLKSVLEYVVSKNPDSTVQEFINILSQIGRNDAVKILQKMILIN